MSDIIITENQTLVHQCMKYLGLCKNLEKLIEDAGESNTAGEILWEARLRTQSVLSELQIVKVQVAAHTNVVEKQIVALRTRFTKIMALYQRIFAVQIPCPMEEVVKRIEMIGSEHEEAWLGDIRMLGLALSLFASYAQKSNSYLVILNYLYLFTGIFRNSILCRNLRAKLGEDNRLTNLRRQQLELFRSFADSQITMQRKFFARTQSVASLENAIRITRGIVELSFVTENEFFDTEHYKKQDEAFTRLLADTRDSAKK